MNNISRTARSVTFAAVVGLSLGISAPGALAQDNTSTPPTAVEGTTTPKGNIDFSKKGSITLHKKLGAESGTNATGKEMNDVPGEALDGVTFKITKLNYDLQNGDWSKFPKKVADVNDENKTTTTFDEKTVDGKATFSDLDLGIYLVEEIGVPEDRVDEDGNPVKIVKGAPFLVSVPMVNEQSDEWNYDVIAYPKNTESKTVKTVKDADKNIQDEYTYTIEADAPQFDGDEKKLKKFEFSDKLDKRLRFQEVTAVKAGDTVLTEADYEVTAPDPEGTNTLEVKLTDAGLAKVKSGDKMSLTFGVKRTEVGKSTDVKNQADVVFNNPNTDEDVTQKTNEVVTYHGKLKVVKKDGKEAGALLPGAEFKLYQCADQDNLGDAISINGKDSWTTGEDGTFTIDGLHVTDYENDAEAPATKKFCLEETKAPAGYALPENTITEIDFTRDNLKATGEYGDDEVTLVSQIENLKQGTPNLPMTGGAGVGILAAIGAAIVAAGAWFARRTSRA